MLLEQDQFDAECHEVVAVFVAPFLNEGILQLIPSALVQQSRYFLLEIC